MLGEMLSNLQQEVLKLRSPITHTQRTARCVDHALIPIVSRPEHILPQSIFVPQQQHVDVQVM